MVAPASPAVHQPGVAKAAPRDAAAKKKPRRRTGNANWLTVPEAAAHFGVAQSTVYNWIKRGLPSVKTMGLGRRIVRDKAEAWLLANGPERTRPGKK